jgi:hypothetical protein
MNKCSHRLAFQNSVTMSHLPFPSPKKSMPTLFKTVRDT